MAVGAGKRSDRWRRHETEMLATMKNALGARNARSREARNHRALVRVNSRILRDIGP